MKSHRYEIRIDWTGNQGTGTASYASYQRSHSIVVNNKPPIPGSSDPAFRGDSSRYNPEELLVASLSACHMLWVLHLCANAGIVIMDYTDDASGTMVETPDGGGHFTEVTLSPVVTITDASRKDELHEVHKRANELCFIANSVNFPVHHEPICKIAPGSPRAD